MDGLAEFAARPDQVSDDLEKGLCFQNPLDSLTKTFLWAASNWLCPTSTKLVWLEPKLGFWGSNFDHRAYVLHVQDDKITASCQNPLRKPLDKDADGETKIKMYLEHFYGKTFKEAKRDSNTMQLFH